MQFKVFYNENWGKLSYYPVSPSSAISVIIAKPGKSQVFPPGFSRAVNTLPTLQMTSQGSATITQAEANSWHQEEETKTQ